MNHAQENIFAFQGRDKRKNINVSESEIESSKVSLRASGLNHVKNNVPPQNC